MKKSSTLQTMGRTLVTFSERSAEMTFVACLYRSSENYENLPIIVYLPRVLWTVVAIIKYQERTPTH